MRIGILIHENESQLLTDLPLFIRILAEEWTSMGFAIEVMRGTRRRVPVDVLVPQVDLTVLPRRYREFLDSYPVVLNRGLHDISKTRISENRVFGLSDDWRGQVIVKSNLNYQGRPEKRLAPPISRFLRKHRRRFEASHDPYRIFSSPAEVPKELFADKRFVVERFLPEREGDQYALRYCLFLGSRLISRRLLSPDPIVKSHNTTHRHDTPPPAGFFEAARANWNIDYGKIDFVVPDSTPILLDVNPTPGFGNPTGDGSHARIARHLAPGVIEYLPKT